MNQDFLGETFPESQNQNNPSPLSIRCSSCKKNFEYTVSADETETICPLCGNLTKLVPPPQKKHQSIGSFLFIVLCLLVGFFSGYLFNHGEKLEFNQGEIFYKSPVMKEEVNLVGQLLVDHGFFDGRPKSIQLLKKEKVYQIRFVVNKGIQYDPGTLYAFKQIGLTISNHALKEAPIEIHFCDSYFKTLKVVAVKEKLMTFEGGEIFYLPPITSEEIKKAGEFFLEKSYFSVSNKPSIQILKKRGKYQFHFVVHKEMDWSEESSLCQSFREIGTSLSNEIFQSAPFEIHLCDHTFSPFKVLKSEE